MKVTPNPAEQQAAFTDKQWSLLTDLFGTEIEKLSALIHEQNNVVAALHDEITRLEQNASPM